MTFRLLAASLLGLGVVRIASAEEAQWHLADVAVACPDYTVYSSFAQFVFFSRTSQVPNAV